MSTTVVSVLQDATKETADTPEAPRTFLPLPVVIQAEKSINNWRRLWETEQKLCQTILKTTPSPNKTKHHRKPDIQEETGSLQITLLHRPHILRRLPEREVQLNQWVLL